MKGIDRVPARVFMALSAFVISTHALPAIAPYAAPIEVRPAQSDDTFSLGNGRFQINGRAPKGFMDFTYLYLEGAMLKSGSERQSLLAQSPTSLRGELYGRRKFKMKKATIAGNQLSFETQPTGRVSFQFSGTVSNAATEDGQPINPQFKGRLSKFMNGKKVVEAQVTFGWLEPEF
jgi:hypothetical protein